MRPVKTGAGKLILYWHAPTALNTSTMRTSVGRAHISANTLKGTITPELSRTGFGFWFTQLPLGRMPGLSDSQSAHL